MSTPSETSKPDAGQARSDKLLVLDRLIDGESKLLALFDARQASADARTAAAVTAALALPAFLLSQATSLSGHEGLLKTVYLIIVALVEVLSSHAPGTVTVTVSATGIPSQSAQSPSWPELPGSVGRISFPRRAAPTLERCASRS